MENNQIINDWIEATDQALEALRSFRALLAAFRVHPFLPMPSIDSLLMSTVDDLAEVGLLEWLDYGNLDGLREVVTGQTIESLVGGSCVKHQTVYPPPGQR